MNACTRVCAHVFLCVPICVSVRVSACVRACVHARALVCAFVSCRLQAIIDCTRTSLENLRHVLAKGHRPSEADRRDLDHIEKGLIPPCWEDASWRASSLALWMQGLQARHAHLQSWTEKEGTTSIWLGGLLAPHAFVRMYGLFVARAAGWEPECVQVTLVVVETPAAAGVEKRRRSSLMGGNVTNGARNRSLSQSSAGILPFALCA